MCQIDQVSDRQCRNRAQLNVTIKGSRGAVTIDICKQCAAWLAQQMPARESDRARRQRLGGKG